MYRGRVDLSLVILSHNSMGFMSSSVRSCPDIFLYFFPSQLLYSFPSQRYRVILSSCFHYPCENTVLNHFAIKGFCTSWNDNWIQLSVRKVQIAFYGKVGKTLLSHKCQSWPWVRVLPVRGVWGWTSKVNFPFLRHTDNGHWIFHPPPAYLGDEQRLRILGRGHSVPTVTDRIDFVRTQCLTISL